MSAFIKMERATLKKQKDYEQANAKIRETKQTLNKQVLRKRVSELETRLNNLHSLVKDIAHNQEAIVTALSSNEFKDVDEAETTDK